MLTKNWFQRFKDARFLVANDEWCVFYPFGPIRGYLLPSSSIDRWARAIFWWELVGSICVWLVSLFASSVFRCEFLVAFHVSVIGFLLCSVLWVRWLTQRLQSLPFRVGMRTYAALRDPQTLWELCLFGSLATVGTVVLAVLGTERAFWCFYTIVFSCITFISRYILSIRSRLDLAKSVSGDVNEDVIMIP